MDKSLEPLEAQTTKDGKIVLIQGSGLDPDCSAAVRITLDQVEEVVFRLREAKEKLTGDRELGEETEIKNRETQTVRTIEQFADRASEGEISHSRASHTTEPH